MAKQDRQGAELRARLNAETGLIGWHELQRFYAGGKVLAVDDSLDLIEVAASVAEDRAADVACWRERGLIAPPAEAVAQQWYDESRRLWAVIVAPWVLVQPDNRREH